MKKINHSILNSACSKIILIGEHSVVYNKPAIAIPLHDIKCYVTIEPNSKKETIIISELFKGNLLHLPEFLMSLKTVILETLSILNQKEQHLIITIDSNIPLERGMGSSAAVSIAIIRSIFNYFKVPLTIDKILELVNISEKIIHGNPSGIDATVIAYEKAMIFQKNKPFIPLTIQLNSYLIVADSGITGSTKEAVNHVKLLQKTNNKAHTTFMNKLEYYTFQMIDAIHQQNIHKIGYIMTKSHHLLQQLQISTDFIDHLVLTALNNGALGAKITGGGLGGCMIALVQYKKQALFIAEQLKNQGAKKVFINKI